jgi:hypothetical protein
MSNSAKFPNGASGKKRTVPPEVTRPARYCPHGPGHFVFRVLKQEAAAREGIDPCRLSFTGALKILRRRLPECPASRRGLRRW